LRALIQWVTRARVTVEEQLVGEIRQGLLVFLGIDKNDTAAQAQALLKKVLAYRVFADQDNRMNLNVAQISGGLMVVSQFTLSADTRKGLRPSFSSAAAPDHARVMYEYFVAEAKSVYDKVECGQFAADMQVELVNDGPVTFLLEAH